MNNNFCLRTTLYAVYKKCRTEEPKQFIKAYTSLPLAEKEVKRNILRITDKLLSTHNIYTSRDGNQYEVHSTLKNIPSAYHRLECIMYIQPYQFVEPEEESDLEKDTYSEAPIEENKNNENIPTLILSMKRQVHQELEGLFQNKSNSIGIRTEELPTQEQDNECTNERVDVESEEEVVQEEEPKLELARTFSVESGRTYLSSLGSLFGRN